MLKTIAAMDLDKINLDLVESLLEWIVDGKHDYPPGENPVEVHLKLFGLVFQCRCLCNPLVSVSRCGACVFARPG